jgi:clan AA aspartic protease
MITGVVNAALEARLFLHVYDEFGQTHAINAIVDTGFSGFLSLPVATIAALGLPWIGRQQVVFADGSFQLRDVHDALIVWDTLPRTVQVSAVDTTPLIGMQLLEGHDVQIRVVRGGAVTINAVP